MSSRAGRRSRSSDTISPRLCSCDVHGGHFVDHHVQDIERFIYEETKELHDTFYNSRKERFAIFKKAFDMLIDESVSFQPILSDINAEYLGVIAAVEKGEQQRAYISRDLKCVVGEEITLTNYKKRIEDLEYKAKLIKSNNEQLRMKSEYLRQEKNELHPDVRKSSMTIKRLKNQSRLVLPGLKMDEQTDVHILSSALAKLKLDVKTMQESIKKNFFPKEQKKLLEQDFQKKERSRNHVSRYNDTLRERLGRVTVAVEAAKSALPSGNGVSKTDMADVVLKALNDYEKMDSARRRDPLQQQHIASDDDDPLKKKESEKLLSYIEHFNDLFDFAEYEAAAIHAATSPMAILRTPQAMQKFKDVEHFDGPKSPLFLYCEALMSTSLEDCGDKTLQLSLSMSLECIACALKESGINLAIHWLNHPCIVTSISLADLFVNWCQCVGNCYCKCHALAEGIYRKFAAHQQVASTLARQGKHRAVIEYGRTDGKFETADFKAVLESNPTVFYAMILLQANVNNRKVKGGISYCGIVNILLGSDEEVLMSFLEHVHSAGVCDAKGIKNSTSDLIFQEMSSDGMTNAKWNKLIDLCCAKDNFQIAGEILSALLVRQALNHASISSSLDYFS